MYFAQMLAAGFVQNRRFSQILCSSGGFFAKIAQICPVRSVGSLPGFYKMTC